MENLNRLMSQLQDMTVERITCRGLDVVNAKKATKVNGLLNDLGDVVIRPLAPVLQKLKDGAVLGGKTDDVKNIFDVAQWCYVHHLYQQAVTYLEEGVISFYCHRHGIDLKDSAKRGLVISAFNIKGQGIPSTKLRVDAKNLPLLRLMLIDKSLNDNQLVNSVNHLVDFRNDNNHCGFRPNHLSANNIEKTSGDLLQTVIEGIANVKIQIPSVPPRSKFFFNLSNHPSCEWGAKQLAEAEKYGQIVDTPFPESKPNDGQNDIERQASGIVNNIIALANGDDFVVHVMGEMTLTFSVVSKLKAAGVTCLASTTARKASMEGNVKTSIFEFVKFREY